MKVGRWVKHRSWGDLAMVTLCISHIAEREVELIVGMGR